MNIFFDVDDTLITWDFRLRPEVRAVFERLREDGHHLYLWSGRGKRWEVVHRYELSDLIVTCHEKPLDDHHAKLAELGVDVVPEFVIDDHYAVVHAFGGYWICPPRGRWSRTENCGRCTTRSTVSSRSARRAPFTNGSSPAGTSRNPPRLRRNDEKP